MIYLRLRYRPSMVSYRRTTPTLKQARIAWAIIGVLLALFLVANVLSPAVASPTTQLQVARDNLANCQELAKAPVDSAQARWARDCVAAQQQIIKLLTRATPTTNPTRTSAPPTTPPVTSSPPTPTTNPPPTSTPPATTPPTTLPATPSCPAWPAVPDAACTGYRHTAVVLRDCPVRVTTNQDGCRFNGTLVIAVNGLTITRSLVNGGHVEGAGANSYDLRGVILQDVEISGPGNDGMAALGNNNYTCIRCDIHGGNRGLSFGSNVLMQDSWIHDFWVQPPSQQGPNSAHQTSASSHGGNNVQLIHNNLRCNSDGYACSGGLNFYAEDSLINNTLIQNNKISTDAGVGIGFYYLRAGKTYDIQNMRVIDNVISSEEYGAVDLWMGNRNGNVWSGNRTPGGAILNP